MKNIMIIDGALNCAYDVFQATDEEFKQIFPKENQDIAFYEDISLNANVQTLLKKIWDRPIHKSKALGIHGTLYFDFLEKKEFFPNLKDSDLDFKGRAFSINEILKNPS
jgi:hypothetical protein